MNKMLIVGSSYSIKSTFAKKFFNHKIVFINFRQIWNHKDIENFDVIIVSGFHQTILKKSLIDIDKYIDDYLKFTLFLKSKTDQLFLISTFIPPKRSFSRVVYFYKNLLIRIFEQKKIRVLSFPKIVDKKIEKKIIFKILNLFKIQFTNQEDLINNTEKYILKSVSEPNFFLLRIPRNMLIERFLRLFDAS